MKRLLWIVLPIVILFTFSGFAMAETLSWNAVTTYTNGTSIGSAAVTYRAFWSTSSSLITLHELGSASGSTYRSFSIDSASMPRGTTIHFTCRAIVGGVESANSSSLSWYVPVLPPLAPSAPTNLRMN
jgi:hypothetical protein